MSWKDKLGPQFAQPTHIEHEAMGVVHKFYPLSTGKVLELLAVAKEPVQAVVGILAGGQSDQATSYKEVGEPARDDSGAVLLIEGRTVRDSETITEAVEPELAEQRLREKKASVALIIETFSDPANHEILGDLIMDSLRWPTSGPAEDRRPTGKVFVDSISPEALVQFGMGVYSANKGAFSPLVDLLGPVAKQAQEKLGDAMDLKTSQESSETQSSDYQSEATT